MSKSNTPLLAEELEFYNHHMEKFLHEYTNRYILIKGKELVGDFATKDEAVGEGVCQFGTGPFLVRLSGEETAEASIPALSLGLLCRL